MQRVSWAGEPQLLGDQYDDLAQQSYWSPDNTGNSGSSALPYTHGNRSRLPIIVSAAIIAVLWTLLAVYACLPPWNRRRARAPSLRRLASRDDDECQELLASGTPASEEEGMGSSQPRASSEGAGFKWDIRLRKRGRSSSNAVDGEQAKKPLREEELRSEDNLQSSDEALPRLASGHAPSHLPEREELLLSSHVSVKTEGEASAETSKTTARVEDFGGPEWVDAYANAPPALEDWFLSFLLDPSSTLSSTEKVKQPDGATEQLDSEETQIASQTTTEDTRQLKEESIEQESLGTQQLSPAQPSTSAGMTSEPQRSENESLETSQHVTSHGHVHHIIANSMPCSSPIPSEPHTVEELSQVPCSCGTAAGHPFYRLPTAAHSSDLSPFNFQRAQYCPPLKPLAEVLNPIRRLLVKPQLDRGELQRLILLSERVVRNAFTMGNFQRSTFLPYQFVEPLARRFLIADTMWCVCEVVGPPMNKNAWWGDLMRRLMELPPLRENMLMSRYHLGTRLRSALEIYATGKRPNACDVVQLKREIFCYDGGPGAFRASVFDPWREDDCC